MVVPRTNDLLGSVLALRFGARSYLSRTKDWDEYPNGRWGDVRSPAWGGFEHYLLMPKVRVAHRSEEHGM
jgi:hypothetical protein